MTNPNCLKENNFDFLRFLFALTVFLVHVYLLSGNEAMKLFSDWLSTEIAVKAFFVVSGFLIFMSYEKSKSTSSYFDKRFRRIYPAYFSIVMLCAVLGGLVADVSPENYFSLDWVKYVIANLLFLNFLHPELPGLFNSNALTAVNGALWTLKIEVLFYLSVPIFVWLIRKYGRWQTLLALYVLSLLYADLLAYWGELSGMNVFHVLRAQLPGQLSYFIAGAALYYWFGDFKRYALVGVVPAVAVVLFRHSFPVGWLEPAALAVVVVYVAYVLPYFGYFAKYGDFSYGIYIVHFPLLQTLIAYGLFTHDPWLALSLSTILVMVIAYLFWHWIEKPFLSKRSHYVEVNHA